MKHLVRKVVIVLVVLALVGGASAWYLQRESGPSDPFRTARVTRGDLVVSIDATGTLEPEEVIDVGAQVAGKIVTFGKDADGKTVDYGSPVEPNMVLAQIDDVLYRAQAAEADAQLQQAQAGLQVAQANLEQANAKLYQAQRDWERAQKLGPSEALAQTTYDNYKSSFEIAKANVALSQASIAEAQATITQAQAASQRTHQNLDYCTIRSPVKGVIIDRRVNTGQTVVASLNAPSLFLLAKDLTRMQVWVAVNEADIGKIHAGQPVSFIVAAFPDKTFQGTVGKVRLNASMTQNVVTYTVEVLTDNSSGQLLPYLTADVQFEQARRNDVLMVPNAALRWTPTQEQIAPDARNATPAPAAGGKRGGRANAQPATPNAAGESPSGQGILWVVDGKYVRPLPVRTGLNNTQMTQVEGEGLIEGMEIATGIQMQAAAPTGTTNPFAPRMPRGGRGGGQPGGQTGGQGGQGPQGPSGTRGGPPGR